MSARCFLVGFLLFIPPVAFAQDGEFHRELSVPEAADLYVSTGSGNIRITPGSEGQITVIGHVHGGWGHKDDVSARIRRIVAEPPIQQSGKTVRIGDAPDRSLFNNISIDYEIRAPRETAVNIRSGSGDLEIDGVGRFLAARSGSGSVRANGIHGSAQLDTGSGDITLEETGSGEVHAHTGSGSVHLRGLDGPVEAHSGSGDLDVAGRLEGPGELSSGSGSIRLHATASSHFSFAASTGSGSVHSQIAGIGSGDQDHHSVSGSVHGGGARIVLRTGSGDIDISE